VTVAVMKPAVSRAAGPAREGSGGRGRERGGGITRPCRGLRCPGISRGAGTAARSAGRRAELHRVDRVIELRRPRRES